MTKPTPSWRDDLRIHPAAELFPLMGDDELAALGEDIRKHGLREPVVVIRQYRRGEDGTLDIHDYDHVLIDGRNRLDAMEAAGFTLVRDGKLDPTLGHTALGLEPLTGAYAEAEDVDPYAFVISANIHRRHLTAEQKRDLIAKLIETTPEKSDRQIAETVKASPTTVGTVRAEMEAKGDVSKLDTRTDSKGRQQPAKKETSAAAAAQRERARARREAMRKQESEKRRKQLDAEETEAKAKATQLAAELIKVNLAERVLAYLRFEAGDPLELQDALHDALGAAPARARIPRRLPRQ